MAQTLQKACSRMKKSEKIYTGAGGAGRAGKQSLDSLPEETLG